MGTLMISIIFAISVEEGIKYLRQIRQEMYDLWMSVFLLLIPLRVLFWTNPARSRGTELIKIMPCSYWASENFFMFLFEDFDLIPHSFYRGERKMGKTKSATKVQNVSTYVLLTFLLAGCSTTTAQYVGKSSMKMAHQTTILNHQTHRSTDATLKSSSNVNFEYEEIITQ